MQRVIDYAKEKGLRRVYGDVLAENKAMLQMCAELGFDEEDIGSGLRRVVLTSKIPRIPIERQRLAYQKPCPLLALSGHPRCAAHVCFWG